MRATHIVNQDRDRVYPIGTNFYPAPVVCGGILMGVNLMMDSINIGTFDTPAEAVQEIAAIFRSTSEVHYVSGYSAGGFADWRTTP